MKLLNLASSCFVRSRFVQEQNETLGPNRKLTAEVDAGMELNSLDWVLWRGAQAPRENARKSVLAPQNKSMLTESGPQTGSLNQGFLTVLSV